MAPSTIVPDVSEDDSNHAKHTFWGGAADSSSDALVPPDDPLAPPRTGTWYHAAWHLTTTIGTPAAFAALSLAYAQLGWAGGVICLFAAFVVSGYNSWLLADICVSRGKTHTRWPELGRTFWGTPGYWIVSFFQQIASIGNNIAVLIAAGLAMKTIFVLYNPDSDSITLQEFIVMFSGFQLILSQLPDLNYLKGLNNLCTFCTFAFAITCLGLSIKNGQMLDRSTIEYDPLSVGDKALITFGIFAALGNVAFAFGDTILPEIRATIKDPQTKNTRMGILLCYSILAISYFVVAVSGFWAFGNTVGVYLPASFFYPRWAIVMVNIFAIVQIAGCFQIYSRPTYQAIELSLMDKHQSPLSKRNVIVRFLITTTYLALVTLAACAIPFFGDFVSLVGAIGFTPLDFVLPILFYNQAKKPKWPLATFHYVLAFLYTVGPGILGFIGASWFINENVKRYDFFANV